MIASYGPIAEAMWTFKTEEDDWSASEFQDHVGGAVLAGGAADLEDALGLLDSPAFIESARAHLEDSWSSITTMADVLVERGTVAGAELWDGLRSPHLQEPVG